MHGLNNKLLLIIIAVTLCMCNISIALDGTDGERFLRCPNGLKNPTSSSELSGRSSMDCIQMCSQTHDCSGVNICPGSMAGKYSCDFTVDLHQGDCMDLSAASQPSCYYVQRDKTETPPTTSVTTTTTPTSTTPLVCQNGGTLNGNQCDCLYKYIGVACEKHARDCSEAYENGKQDDTEEALFIRPTGAPAPIKVRCQYSWGGATILLQWKSSSPNFNQDFATLKAGIGDDPMGDVNYFVGLDSLYYFTSQADYELNFQANDYKDHIYENFTFGPESSSYAISYDRFKRGTYGDGFAVSPPLTFSADGHDADGCYAAKGKAGWYGAGCTGYPTFTDGNFDWPDGNGGTVSVDSLFIKFVRESPYYDDKAPAVV